MSELAKISMNATSARRIGRIVRGIVDESLRLGDGSGETEARDKLDALAEILDPEQTRANEFIQALGPPGDDA
jgi:hypothetical protein